MTLETFIKANLWDEARVFVGSIKFKEGTQAPTLAKNQFKKQSIGTDELTQTKNYD